MRNTRTHTHKHTHTHTHTHTHNTGMHNYYTRSDILDVVVTQVTPVLQLTTSSGSPVQSYFLIPVLVGSTHVRVLRRVPPSQVCEQEDQLDHAV